MTVSRKLVRELAASESEHARLLAEGWIARADRYFKVYPARDVYRLDVDPADLHTPGTLATALSWLPSGWSATKSDSHQWGWTEIALYRRSNKRTANRR